MENGESDLVYRVEIFNFHKIQLNFIFRWNRGIFTWIPTVQTYINKLSYLYGTTKFNKDYYHFIIKWMWVDVDISIGYRPKK